MRAENVPDDPQVLQVRVCRSEGRVDLVLTGELDLEGASIVADRLSGEVLLTDPQVMIDLSGVSFVDSEGVRTLLTLHQRHDARLCRPSERVRRSFELMGLDHLVALET